MSEPFLAEIRIFAGNFAPMGWAFCNGQLLPLAQNTALFAIIGTTYGGDGSTNLALPNLQGRAPMHAGRGPGLTNRRLGEQGGTDTVTLAEAHLPPHTHSVVANSAPASTLLPDGNSALARSGSGFSYNQDPAPPTVNLHDSTIGDIGQSDVHNHSNMQPFLTLNFIIALAGIFPQRN